MLVPPSCDIARAAATIVALLVVACAEGPSGQRPPHAATWTLTPELRIGSLDEPEETLSEVTGLSVGLDGAVYVTQWGVPAVHVFNDRGNFVRAIGRGGGGPGEFSQPGALGWLGDTLWVVDMPVGRIHLFLADGNYLETLTIVSPPIEDHYYGLGPLALMADGSLVSQPAMAAHLLARGIETQVPLFRSDRSLQHIDTLAFVSMANEVLEIRHGGRVTFTDQPITDHDLHAVFPDGSGLVVVQRGPPSRAASPSFRVTRIQPSGDTAFSRTFDYEPLPLTDLLLDSLVAQLRRRLRGPAPPHEAAIRESLYRPAFLPPVDAVVAGRDETIWLRRSSDRDRGTWMVLDEDGDPLASLRAPADLRLFQAERDEVWGVAHDSLDVPYVVRYRVHAE